ncbi:trifunctional transcriptional activator/DNA repair protein Ada/methylated-DNA--[protein]-cysteine S-methyltransferase [Ascidiaceihabitans sp.]|uniref:bifunctional transcriptional activator/DNA repair enzyme AdaA n=1 Tax=Ascidiaceihabitans sp. TaxID=1872644 RepID=UPI003296F1FC
MLFTLPSDAILYNALIARDPAYDGRAFVGVRSTGVFCRLTCPARKPKAENCSFHDSPTACIDAGFRPCKRCHPMHALVPDDPAVQDLLTRLDTAPTRRWSEADVKALGHDPSTIRRAFKRHFGTTFLDLARARRLQAGFTTLADGGRVIDAQLEAGFDSPSAFRKAFAAMIGLPPGGFQKSALLKADWFQTVLGPMIGVADNTHLHLLEFADRKALPAELKRLVTSTKSGVAIGSTPPLEQVKQELQSYFDGQNATFTTPLALHGTPFTKDVWRALQTIPAGHTRSYAALAETIQRPTATRAVARANGANQIAILIPCHRVIGTDGALTGYGGGVWRKRKLIDLERQYL